MDTQRTRTMAHDAAPDMAGVVDLESYPLHDLDHPRIQELIQTCQAQLRDDGCIVLRGFIAPEARESVRQESRALSKHVVFRQQQVNAYFTEEDTCLPASDPRRHFMVRTSGFVPRDCFGADSLINAVYDSPLTKRFLARCFEVPALYDYADPLAGLTINVVPPQAEFPWHYDTNHFAVTLMTQAAESGGEFEYAPDIRTPEGENLAGVKRILCGQDRASVKSLTLQPGDLQLFKGRYSLHRVAPTQGPIDRLLAVFAYCEEPGMIGRLARTRQLFGRVTQTHIDAQARLARNDALVD